MTSRRTLLAASLALPALSFSLTVRAQPTRPTKLIVGTYPESRIDVAARRLVSRVQPSWPGGLVVENRGGAGGRLAIEQVKNSPPDGTTMLFTSNLPITIYPYTYRKLAYDPVKDLTPVAVCAKVPLAFVVGPMVPDDVTKVAHFVAWAKANPKQAAVSSTVPGGTSHFAGMMFARAAGIDLLYVPYKGGSPALRDMMGGQIASGFTGTDVRLEAFAPRLRVLATTGSQRSRFLPDVPTMVELGYEDVVAEDWIGVFMPPNTPAPIVNYAAGAINESLKTPETREIFESFLRMETIPSSPERFGALIASDLAAWGPIIKASGFSAEALGVYSAEF